MVDGTNFNDKKLKRASIRIEAAVRKVEETVPG